MPTPVPDKIALLKVLITAPDVAFDEAMSQQLIGQIKKSNGERVILAAQEHDLTEDIKAKINEIMRGVKINTTGPLSEDTFSANSRTFWFEGNHPIGADNAPMIFDVALGAVRKVVGIR